MKHNNPIVFPHKTPTGPPVAGTSWLYFDDDGDLIYMGPDGVSHDVTGGSGFSGSYNDLTDVPSEFPPEAHNHAASDINSGTLDAARLPDLSGTYQPLNSTLTGLNGKSTTGTGAIVLADSAALTGTPTAPTASGTTNTTQIATTAMVQAALAAYIAAQDVLVFKGVIDCSANPNYPAADAGHVYKVSVAGKIGGGSGPNVEVGDVLTCTVDSSASGNHATVGANWVISQVNIDGAVTGPTSATSGNIATFNGTTGKLIQDGGVSPSSFAAASHNHAASDINSGTMATARLGSGTANSGTFLRGDQTWASPPSGSVATDTIFDAKGDLPVGTGADTAQKLSVGTNGQSLVADSGQTTGLKYAWTGLVQAAFAESTTGLTGSTAIPVDDTIPQSGEGIEIITCSITPKSTSHRLKITLSTYVVNSAASTKSCTIALFRDSVADAIKSTVHNLVTNGLVHVTVVFYVTPNSTSSETYKFRMGLVDTTTMYVGRTASGSLYSTTDAIQMIVEEIAQ